MRKYYAFFIIQTLICYLPLKAATFYQIDTTAPLRCFLSLNHHNRIMVDKGRVLKVIYPDENISIRLEEHSGQAFIYAVGSKPKPFTLAVVTESGLVQDIEIAFDDRPSEVVILKEPVIEELVPSQPEEEIQVQPLTREALLNSQINDILAGQLPCGYLSCPMERAIKKVKRGIQAIPVAKFEGIKDVLYVYEVTNTSRRKNQIKESELEYSGYQWVFLEKHSLAPKEKILAIISVGKL